MACTARHSLTLLPTRQAHRPLEWGYRVPSTLSSSFDNVAQIAQGRLLLLLFHVVPSAWGLSVSPGGIFNYSFSPVLAKGRPLNKSTSLRPSPRSPEHSSTSGKYNKHCFIPGAVM